MSAEPSLKFRQSGTSCSRAVAKPYWVTESCDRNVRGQDRVVANSFSLLLGSPQWSQAHASSKLSFACWHHVPHNDALRAEPEDTGMSFRVKASLNAAQP